MDYLNSNPSLIWPEDYSEEAPERDNFWDWWADNGEGASSAANALLCAINPRRYGCNPSDNSNHTTNTDNTPVYIVLGVVILLFLLLLFKK